MTDDSHDRDHAALHRQIRGLDEHVHLIRVTFHDDSTWVGISYLRGRRDAAGLITSDRQETRRAAIEEVLNAPGRHPVPVTVEVIDSE